MSANGIMIGGGEQAMARVGYWGLSGGLGEAVRLGGDGRLRVRRVFEPLKVWTGERFGGSWPGVFLVWVVVAQLAAVLEGSQVLVPKLQCYWALGYRFWCVQPDRGWVQRLVSLSASIAVRKIGILATVYSLVPKLDRLVQASRITTLFFWGVFSVFGALAVAQIRYCAIFAASLELYGLLQMLCALLRMNANESMSVLWFNLWTVGWILFDTPSAVFRILLLWVLVYIWGKNKGEDSQWSVLVGGYPLTEGMSQRMDQIMSSDSNSADWASVRVDALKGDRVLKYLLAKYTERLGGTVAQASELEQKLQSDKAFGVMVQKSCVDWWKRAPVHMSGSNAATLLEALWGLVIDSEAGYRAFVKFIHTVALANGYHLRGMELFKEPLN